VRLGVTVRSITMRREGDETGTGRGGVVWQRADSRDGWETVEIHRGQVKRFRVLDDDIDWSAYTGIVDARYLEGLRRGIARDMANNRRGKYHTGNMAAFTKITMLLEVPGSFGNNDQAVG
jgi:hypothetical protein